MEEKRGLSGAVVLAAGAGKRMNSSTKKQFLLLGGKPLVYYSLKAFEESFVGQVVLVTASEDIEYCRKEIVEKYGFTKVKHITAGGKERYHSVAAGLQCLSGCDYVFIHDGARPMLTAEILDRAYDCVCKEGACVVGMPSKDTVKIGNDQGFIESTPDRKQVWNIQTPQVFASPLIKEAYQKLIQKETELQKAGVNITDDAMVVETLTEHRVALVKGSYENIKVTTPEDLKIAELFLAE